MREKALRESEELFIYENVQQQFLLFAEFTLLFSSEINSFANFRYYCFINFRNSSESAPVLRFNGIFNYTNA
jgi:hypothetical protein